MSPATQLLLNGKLIISSWKNCLLKRNGQIPTKLKASHWPDNFKFFLQKEKIEKQEKSLCREGQLMMVAKNEEHCHDGGWGYPIKHPLAQFS